ncbi:formin-like protein 3 [Sturnira hondurensis]|uniref:formin-like protein 3 n=1 Tax=Sturnira hondurensis TaxID=192404 RepID=UPI00187AEA02|nr:formin-like protein 3 [Sturnira hondurensis]
MVSARGISLLLLESRSSYTLSSSPQHCGPGGEATIPPPSARVALRGGSRPAGWRCSGGRGCPGGFLGSGGKRADSSDAGLAGFAPLSRLSVLIKQLCVRRRPSPLSTPSVPSVPAPAPRPPEGVSGSARRNPAPPKPPPAAAPRALPCPRPSPSPPPNRRRCGLRGSRTAAPAPPAPSSALRHRPGPAGGTPTRRPPSCSELRGETRGRREAARGPPSAPRASPHLAAPGRPAHSRLRGPQMAEAPRRPELLEGAVLRCLLGCQFPEADLEPQGMPPHPGSLFGCSVQRPVNREWVGRAERVGSDPCVPTPWPRPPGRLKETRATFQEVEAATLC